ncbi:MAG TPA: acyltransferase [Chloroflexia bacterium]|nr:acyltransferase [Chloroflexia bacterium]
MIDQARAGGPARVAIQLYRGNRFKKLVKPFVVKAISAFWLRVYKLWYGKRVLFGRNFISRGNLVIRGPGRVVFGDNINAWSHAEKNVLITYTPDALITIGDDCRLNGAGIQAYRQVRVGSRCILSSTIIVDTDFHPLDPATRHDHDALVVCAPIFIGENVWLAGQTAILKGVTIGDNSVVGFRAVVTKDVPPNVVVGGNPARIVKRLDEGA